MNFLAGFPLVVQRGVRGKFGDITYADHHTIEGCFMAPRYSSETDDRGSRVITGFSVYGPPDSDLLADDRVKTPDGNIYKVQGEVAEWENPFTGWKPGFEAAVERVK